MDRRIALFVFGVFVLFACDDSNGYDTCKSKGCEKKERTASWRSEQLVDGTVTALGKTFRDTEIRATRSGFVVERYDTTVPDAGKDAADADATDEDASAADPDAGADADAEADAAPEEQLHSYGDTVVYRVRVSFMPPLEPGHHRLEDVRAVARLGSRAIDLTGTLDVLEAKTEDVSRPGAPTTPPYEMPFAWVMKTTNEEVAVDLRVESRATWSDSYGYGSCY